MEDFAQPDLIRPHDGKLRVFISSSLAEMGPEREAVRNAITSLRLHPIMFEDNARPHPPRNVYQRLLGQSDVYVGIFGERYGWLGPGMEISGLEDEYNLSRDKARLLYIKTPSNGRDSRLTELVKRIENDGEISYKPFRSASELADAVQDDVMQLLSERFGVDTAGVRKGFPLPNYLDDLRAEMRRSQFVDRPALLDALRNVVSQNPITVITGEPGIGKTFLLGSYAAQCSAIYLAVQNRTVQSVCSHIANHLLVRRGLSPRTFPSESDARHGLQEQLVQSVDVVVLDNVDANEDVLKAILDLDRYKARFILGARKPRLGAQKGISEIRITPFTESEAEQFLALSNLEPARRRTLQIQDDRFRNPLYLYYYATFPLSPVPQSLNEYQRVLWEGLSAEEQEVVALVAHSYVEIDTSELHDLRTRSGPSPVTTTKRVLDATPLLQQRGGGYQVFHPFFEEYVLSRAADDGLAVNYHTMLAEFAAHQGWAVPTAFHFLRAGDERLTDNLLPAASALVLQGDWKLAGEMLNRGLELLSRVQDCGWEAHVRYLLAHLHLERGLYQNARAEADRTLTVLANCPNKADFRRDVEIWSSLLLLEEGRADDAVSALEQAVQWYSGNDPHREAMARVDLSFVYMRLSRLSEGAEQSAYALNLFTELGDEQGVATSLTNLSNCLGGLDRRAEQRRYIDRMLAAADKRGLPRLRCAGLNHLAGWLRRQNQPLEAQAALEEALVIAKELGSPELEALYTANLGNACRDQGNVEASEEHYRRSLKIAREHHLRRWEGYALEMLGELFVKQKRHKEAFQLCKDALAIHEATGEQIRIASTLDNMATVFDALNQTAEAAEHQERASEIFHSIRQFKQAGDSFAWSFRYWHASGNSEHAAECATKAINSMLESGDVEAAHRLLDKFRSTAPASRFGDMYMKVFKAAVASSYYLMALLYELLAYAKSHLEERERKIFNEALELLLSRWGSASEARLFDALAVAIEQADSRMISSADLDSLATKLSEHHDRLYYCSVSNGIRAWTVGLDWENPAILQVTCAEENETTQQLAFALAMVFLGHSAWLGKAISGVDRKESAVTLAVLSESALRKRQGFLWPTARATPVLVMLGDYTDSPTCLVIKDDYASLADWNTHPNNNSFLMVIAIATGALLSSLTGLEDELSRKHVSALLRLITESPLQESEPVSNGE